MPNYRVKLGTSLLESMTLATVEAFSFRGPRSSSKTGVETYGYVWGSKKTYPDGDIVFFLDKLSVSLTAKRAALSVEPNRRAGKIKDELFKQLAPHQTLLADFHSHPYPSNKAVTAKSRISSFRKSTSTISSTTTFFGKAPTTPRSCWFKPYAAVIVQPRATWVGKGKTFFTSMSASIGFG